MSVYFGGGDGTFPTSITPTLTALPSTRGMAVGDFNGDGKLDIALSSAAIGNVFQIQVYSGIGDGTFQSPVNSSSSANFFAGGRLLRDRHPHGIAHLLAPPEHSFFR
jgi:FG-GAP-like repeat